MSRTDCFVVRGRAVAGWAEATRYLAAANFFLDSSRYLCAANRRLATSCSFYALISAYLFCSSSLLALIFSTPSAFRRISSFFLSDFS